MDGGQLSSADLPFGTRTGSRTLVLGVLRLWTDNAIGTGQPEEKVPTSGDCGLAEEYRRTEYNSRIDNCRTQLPTTKCIKHGPHGAIRFSILLLFCISNGGQ